VDFSIAKTGPNTFSAAPVIDKKGNIIGTVLTFRDITKEYLLNQKLIYQQTIIQKACELAKIAIGEFDFKGNLITANDYAYEIFELEQDKKITRAKLLSLIIDKDRELVKKYIKMLIDRDKNNVNFTFKIITPKTKKTKTIFCIIEYQKDTQRFIFIGQNISNFVELKNQLIQSEEKFKTIYQEAPVGIIVYDKDTTITECNPFFAKGIGTSINNLIGFNMKKNIKHRGILNAVLNSLKQGTGTYEGEYTSVLTNKTSYIRLICKGLQNDDGKIIGGVGIGQDLTELELQRQELFKLQKLESISTLAGGIAHDFNNLLTGIFGQIKLAKAKLEPTHSCYKNLEKAEQVLERAQRITNQLLSLTKGWKPVKEHIDIKTFLKSVVDFDLSGSNIKPVYNFQGDIWPVMGDIPQLERAISNIVINAKQAMKQGGKLEINVSNVSVDQQNKVQNLSFGKYVCIEIKDTGPGIEEKILNKIFDPFFTTKPKGTGLGLTISFSVVKKHGGTIVVNSKKGVGTSFIIYLPASMDKKIITKQKEQTPINVSKKAKILFLDDEEMLQEIVQEILTLHGFHVDLASTGQEAVKKYKSAFEAGEPHDLVIMDLTIPGGMGGKETINEILKRNKDAKCIITSGYGDDQVLANYGKYGFKAALKKPFQLETLVEVINDVL